MSNDPLPGDQAPNQTPAEADLLADAERVVDEFLAGVPAEYRAAIERIVRPSFYRLSGTRPVPVGSALEMARWMVSVAGSRGAVSVARSAFGGVTVSTIFLGIDHNWMGDGPPLLFETMVFGGPHAERQHRYSSWEAALAGHHAICLDVFGDRIDQADTRVFAPPPEGEHGR